MRYSRETRAILFLAWICTAFQPALFSVRGAESIGAGAASFPQLELPGISRGQKAISELGARLPAVAQVYGLAPEKLRSLLLKDQTLAIDHSGRLFATDPKPQLDAAGPAVAGAASIPLSETFKLHSRSNAHRIIYLDFDGHTITGSGWNGFNGGQDIVAPAFDMDGLPETFNDTERTLIQEVWRRVAEDYAPFDVDVTTELTNETLITRSSVADDFWGTRILISPISSYFGLYGGIAYIGVYNAVGDDYKPALVFPENLGPNHAPYIAEAASHEAGHNLGLGHDGTSTQNYYQGHGSGATSWGPIMGSSYGINVSQWSKGEYSGANNFEDDLAVIQSYGLSYRVDDHGNSSAAATVLSAGSFVASGVIEQSTDIDVFRFTTPPGTVNISVTPSDIGPNLDIMAELRDTNGVLIASNNPAAVLNASINMSLSAGTYLLHVRGAGFGDPLTNGYSSYASLGQYSISGTTPAPTVVSRKVFYNNSSWDGNNPAANTNDDAAIATNKAALLPGGTATFTNYTSYSRGINGIMVDLTLSGTPTAADFSFKIGNNNLPGGWTNAPAPSSISVRAGAGLLGTDRVTIIWPDNAIQKQWLQVSVLATTNTSLASPDVFYFGNAIAESGNSTLNAQVDLADEIGARNNPHNFVNPASIIEPHDYDRNGKVDLADEIMARNNAASFVTALRLISLPAGAAAVKSVVEENLTPRMTIERADSEYRLAVRGVADQVPELQMTDDLGSEVWITVSVTPAFDPETSSWKWQIDSTGAAHRFFRVLLNAD